MKILSATIALVFCIASFACAKTKIPAPATVDLDGNGHKEKVWIAAVNDTKDHVDHCILHVDKAEVPVYGELGGLAIIDVDRSDAYKEIDVWTYSGSDMADHSIYWYDGAKIHKMADLSWSVDYRGNGIVLNSSWTGYVAITNKYILNKKARTLELVPQEMYYIGAAHKTAERFPIYYSRQSKSVVATVERNSTITILVYVPAPPGTDLDKHDMMQDWFLIKTQSGLLGWVRLQTLAEYVEGMQGAG